MLLQHGTHKTGHGSDTGAWVSRITDQKVLILKCLGNQKARTRVSEKVEVSQQVCGFQSQSKPSVDSSRQLEIQFWSSRWGLGSKNGGLQVSPHGSVGKWYRSGRKYIRMEAH